MKLNTFFMKRNVSRVFLFKLKAVKSQFWNFSFQFWDSLTSRRVTGTYYFYVLYTFTHIGKSTLQFLQLTENLIMLPVKSARLVLEAVTQCQWLNRWIISQEVPGSALGFHPSDVDQINAKFSWGLNG